MGYWQERAQESRRQLDKVEKSSFARLQKLLNDNLKDVNRQIEQFDLENINETLTKRQKTVLLNKLKKTADYDERDKYLRQLYDESAKLYKIDRLQALKLELQNHLSEMTQQQTLNIEKTLYNAGKIGYDTFKNAVEDIYNIKLNSISRATINSISNQTWIGSLNWSERIWKDRSTLGKSLDDLLKKNIVQGRSLEYTARLIKSKFHTSTYNAMRLVRTESTYTHEQASLKFYEDTACKKYEFMAHLDDRTSEICSHEDGQTYNIKDAVVGVNYPPMHPNCRSTTAPVIDEKALLKKYGID